MDTEGAIESVHIKRVMLLKSKRHLLLVQDTKGIMEDISIVKLNISNFPEPLFHGLNPWKH